MNKRSNTLWERFPKLGVHVSDNSDKTMSSLSVKLVWQAVVDPVVESAEFVEHFDSIETKQYGKEEMIKATNT